MILTQTPLKNCGGNSKGLQKILFCDYSFYEGYNLDGDGIITALRGSQDWLYWKLLDLPNCEFTETEVNGNYLQTLTLTIQGTSNEINNALKQLKATEIICIFLDSNGKYKFIGENKIKMIAKEIKIGENVYNFTLRTIGDVTAKEVLNSYGKTL